MNESGFIFSHNELMVMLSILGGEKLYGFWHQKSYKPDEIIQSFNTLLCDGLISLINKQIVLKPEVKTLLNQILAAQLIVLVTLKENDTPQICYAVGKEKIVGYHTISVQKDTVSLFSLPPHKWEDEIYSKKIIPNIYVKPQNIYCLNEQQWSDFSVNSMDDIPNSYCYIQYLNPAQNKNLLKIILCKKFGQIFLLKNNGQNILKTNDLSCILKQPFDMEDFL